MKRKIINKALWISGSLIIILTTICLLNSKAKNLAILIYYNIKNSHFSYGEKIYAYRDLFDNKKNQAIPTFRLMRPLTATELETMDKLSRTDINIDKNQYYDNEAKPVMVFSYKLLIEDNMQAEHSALLGNYTGSHTEDVFLKDHLKRAKNIFYSFIPNKKVLESKLINFFELPVNYTWVDSTLYILPEQVSKTETLK